MLLTPKDNIFITDSRYIEAVNSYLTLDQEIAAFDLRGLSKYDYESYFAGCNSVGFEEGYVTYEMYKSYLITYRVDNLVETEHLIEINRFVKDEEEIDNCKKACLITDKAFEHIKEYIRPGQTEKEIALELERYMKMNGAESLAFDTIVASGPNSSMPHAIPTDRKIEEKDIIQFDFGCKVNGYCSDFSRVLFIGEITDEEEKVYQFVLKEYNFISERLKDGINIKETLKEAEEHYKEENYELLHSFGHNLGLDIHEEPVLSTRYETKLKKNMLLTVEPGVYIPGKFGIRIEDTILINKDGSNSLTKSAKAITVLKYNNF
ncbi:MAG: M24 family metallopeptidase [Clostridia bacterium]|nr:M24 family metallopeptidase [Clostridia bacterium]